MLVFRFNFFYLVIENWVFGEIFVYVFISIWYFFDFIVYLIEIILILYVCVCVDFF